MFRMRKAAALAAVVILGVGAAACGGDDDGDKASDEVADEGAGRDASSGRDEPRDDIDLDDLDADIDLSGLFEDEDCAAFYEAMANAGAGVASIFTGDSDALVQAAAFFSEVAKNLPDEIAGDFETFAGAYQDFAMAMAESGIDFEDPATFTDPEVMAQLEPVIEKLDTPEVQAASERIDTWLTETCGTD